jgi:hypothetical protein
VRRVVVLATLASLGVVAWAIAGGAAGLLYAAAAAIALVGLLLPPALKRRRGDTDVRVDPSASAGEPVPIRDSRSKLARPLPGIRRLGFVRELEARLAEHEDENRALRERLEKKVEALRHANELLVLDRSERDQALIRVEHSLARHSRERALLETQLEAIEAIVAQRSLPARVPAFGAGGAATAAEPPKRGSEGASERPKLSH